MKLIFSGETTAAAILDSPEEIETVRAALYFTVNQSPDAPHEIERKLLAEFKMKAPA